MCKQAIFIIIPILTLSMACYLHESIGHFGGQIKGHFTEEVDESLYFCLLMIGFWKIKSFIPLVPDVH